MALEAWEGIPSVFSVTLEAILSVGAERKDSVKDRLLGHFCLCLPYLAFRKDLQSYSKIAETLIESTKDPKGEVGRKAGKGKFETGGGLTSWQ